MGGSSVMGKSLGGILELPPEGTTQFHKILANLSHVVGGFFLAFTIVVVGYY